MCLERGSSLFGPLPVVTDWVITLTSQYKTMNGYSHEMGHGAASVVWLCDVDNVPFSKTGVVYGLGRLLIHHALQKKDATQSPSVLRKDRSTHVESPTVKNILHVHIVAHGINTSHTNATSMVRTANTRPTASCWARRRMSKSVGSRGGISFEYTTQAC